MISKYTLYDGRNLYVGLSTDSKPTDAKNGDIFNATNVGSTEVYDGTNWRIQTGDNSIPTPTAEDEGKVLVVDSNGEYALGNIGGALICTDTHGTLDKTMGEIQAAIQAGVTVFVNVGSTMGIVTVDFVHPLKQGYEGSISMFWSKGYVVREDTEAAALAAYPHYFNN